MFGNKKNVLKRRRPPLTPSPPHPLNPDKEQNSSADKPTALHPSSPVQFPVPACWRFAGRALWDFLGASPLAHSTRRGWQPCFGGPFFVFVGIGAPLLGGAGWAHMLHSPAAMEQGRQRGDSNPCGQSPMDFESISLTTRTHCLAELPPPTLGSCAG
jgi:hypothetical protein